MIKKLIIKTQWKKFITSGIFIKKSENLGIYATHGYRGEKQLNWERLWMYLNYQFKAINSFSKTSKKSAIMSDHICVNQAIKNVTKKTLLCSYWNDKNTGDLTNILVSSNKPNFIINVGMEFPKRFFGEAKILLVPTVNFINNMNLPLYRGVYYNIPFLNKDIFLLKQISTIYANLFDKHNSFSKQYAPDLFNISLQYVLRKRFAHFDFKNYLIKKTTENAINLRKTEKKWFNLIKQTSQNYTPFFKIYCKFRKLQQYTYFVNKKNSKKKIKHINNKKKKLEKKMNKNFSSPLFLSQKLYIYQLEVKMRKKLYLYELYNFLFSINYKINFLCKKIILNNKKEIKKQMYFVYFKEIKQCD